MKKIFISICALLSLCLISISFAKQGSATLVLDALNRYQLPENFRDTSTPASFPKDINSQGLDTLNILGSGQFSQHELETVKQKIKAHVLIFDLRQESHGYINGNAVSWYARHNGINHGKTDEQAAQDESNRLSAIGKLTNVTVYEILSKNSHGAIAQKKAITFPVEQVYDEATLADRETMGYERVYVADHDMPTPHEVDHFIAYTRYLPAHTWLYFHCRAGVGRTTTFMAMYDMMRNAKQVSFQDIIKRQYRLAGINLNEASDAKRIAFLKRFYQYCLDNKDGFKTKWSTWSK